MSTSVSAKKRIDYFDIAKGFGIFFVVWAHAGAPGQNMMYQFHMPFFMLISGILFSSKKSIPEYIKGKILSLYVPFAFWNLLFYTAKSLVHHVALSKILIFDFKILLTIEKDGEFFGATWYLGALLIISILYKLLDTALKKVRFRSLVLLGFFSCVMVLGFCVDLPYMFSRTAVLSAFFAGGVVIKDYKRYFSKIKSLPVALLCIAGFVFIALNNYAKMNQNDYSSPVLFVIGSLLASYGLMCLSIYLDRVRIRFLLPVKKALTLLGKRSMDILIWQFVTFRAAILLQMFIKHDEITISNLLSHYPRYFSSNGWWLVYLAVGLVLPILFCSIFRSGPWGKFFKKTHLF